jgi:hypothetical protein
MVRTLITILAAASLAACATAPPPYGAAAAASAAGYSERQIESNRYFVTFRAPSGAEVSVLEDYALLRAAEITLENDRDWFWVDRRTLDGLGAYYGGPTFGIGVGGGSWGHHGGGGVSVGVDFPIGSHRGETASAATLEIRFGEGPKPDDANAYDAHATSANLRARTAP